MKFIKTKVKNAVHIVKAITILHNVIIDMEGYKNGSTDVNDVPTIIEIRRSRNNNHPSNAAVHIRNTLVV